MNFVVGLLLSLVWRTATSQKRLFLTWDRHWLASNTTNIKVNLGDQMIFNCQVNNATESPQDLHENLIRLEEDRCDSTGIDSAFIGFCMQDKFDITVLISNSSNLVNRASFNVGRVYYFTSFSNGTLQSAEYSRVSGGGCTEMPPLRLTVSVVPKTSSVTMMSTPSSPSPTIAKTRLTVTSSSLASEMSVETPTATSITSVTITPLSSPPDRGSIGSAAGRAVLLHCFVILLFAFVLLIIN